MASPSYIRNGYVYIPAFEVNRGGMVGGPVVDIYSNFNVSNASQVANTIIDSFTIPGGTMDVAGQLIYITAMATTAATVNSKTLLVNWGGTGAVGSAVSGGTTIATITTTASAAPLLLEMLVVKTGPSAQNLVQITAQQGVTLTAPAVVTAANNDQLGIQVSLVQSDTVAPSEITVQCWYAQFGM